METNPPVTTTTAAKPARRFRLPEGQSLIWWLIDMQRGVIRQMLAFIGFVLVFHFLFQWSWSLSLAMILSMFLHECGHALVFVLARIRVVILFLFPLGAVAAPADQEENRRSDRLHWNTISWLLNAGPMVNVGLIILFLLLQPVLPMLFSGETATTLAQFARDMVYVNGLLAAMNLVPVWTLDAGQLFKVIYSSLHEHYDRLLTGVSLTTALAVLLVILRLPGFVNLSVILGNLLARFGWVVFLFVFAIGMVNKSQADDPDHAHSDQAMSNGQVIVHLVVYTVMVAITLWVFAGPLV